MIKPVYLKEMSQVIPHLQRSSCSLFESFFASFVFVFWYSLILGEDHQVDPLRLKNILYMFANFNISRAAIRQPVANNLIGESQ